MSHCTQNQLPGSVLFLQLKIEAAVWIGIFLQCRRQQNELKLNPRGEHAPVGCLFIFTRVWVSVCDGFRNDIENVGVTPFLALRIEFCISLPRRRKRQSWRDRHLRRVSEVHHRVWNGLSPQRAISCVTWISWEWETLSSRCTAWLQDKCEKSNYSPLCKNRRQHLVATPHTNRSHTSPAGTRFWAFTAIHMWGYTQESVFIFIW